MSDDQAANFARARAAAGVLFFDDDGRVMLVEPVYKGYRDVPAGMGPARVTDGGCGSACA